LSAKGEKLSEKDKTDGFKSFGEFLVKVRKACDGEGSPDSRLKTAGHMEIGEDSQGGFLVPEKWAEGIYNIALENSIVRKRATVLKAISDSLKIRTFVDNDRSSSLFGGITFKWLYEAINKTYGSGRVTKPALGQLELTPHKLVGGCYTSNEIEGDYEAFGGFMQEAFGQAIRFIEDDAFINGTGAGQPLGIVQSNLMIKPNRQQANQIGYEDLTAMVRRLLPDSWNRAVWLINQDAMEQIMTADTVVNNVLNVLDLNDHMLMGFPFIVTEKAQALGTTGDIMLADFGAGHYIIADRSIEISGSRHVSGYSIQQLGSGWLTDETFWRIVLRVDGQPVAVNPITPYHGAQTVSPFIGLDAETS
jgi:HK97 family phage major capsid protein